MTGAAYDAVFWDIGGVIVDLASIREAYASFVAWLAEEHGLDEEEALDTWRGALGDYFRSRQGTTYRTAHEGYRVATNALFPDGEAPPEDAWRPAFERHLDAAVKPVDGAVETIHTLGGTDRYLGVISDIDTAEAEAILSSFGVREAFDAVTTSEAVGYTKPDRRIFEAALDEWGGDPGRAVMVGDRYEHDVAGATDAGLDAVGYGPDAVGEQADYEVDDLREVPGIVGVDPTG